MCDYNEMECTTPVETEKKEVKIRKKRDIFRFKGEQDMAINVEYMYKMVREGKKITFQGSTTDFVEFESEEIAENAFNQIIGIWSTDVLE